MNSPIFDKLITLFNKAEKALTERNTWAAEAYSTNALRALDEIKIKLLVMRVNAYLQLGEFRKAHADTRSILGTAIEDERFIQKLHIYFKEKRYWDVIEMGNRHILDSTFGSVYMHPRRRRFAAIQHRAMEIMGKYRQIDIMKRLPHEVRSLVLDQLDFIDILNCLHVSKDWRRYVYNCSAATREHVILDNETREKGVSFSSKFYKSSIRLLNEGVKSLKIDECTNEQTQEEILDMLTSVSFNRLRTLTIVNFPDFPAEQLRRLLRNSSHFLEEVFVNDEIDTCNEILDICPNLQRLHCRTYNVTSQLHLQLYPLPQHSSLTYLWIDTVQNSHMKDLERLLSRSPNLKELIINNGSANLDSLHLINQYDSKQLHHICTHTPSDTYDGLDPLARYNDTFIDTSRFEYTIDVHDCRGVTAKLLLQLINHSVDMKQKIKAISFSLSPESQLNDWCAFKYFTSPCLQFMRFSFTEETEEIFATVIRNCPTLQEISIFRLLCAPSRITMDALKTLPALQCFAIENAACELHDEHEVYGVLNGRECITNVNDALIREFFVYHALLGSRSTLQEVRLRHVSNLESETLKALFKIKGLKSLNLAGCDIVSNQQGIGSAIFGTEGGSLLPTQIENLWLEEVQEISDCDLQFLDCTAITLAGLVWLTRAGLQKMMDSAKKLKKMTVYECGVEYNLEEGALLKDIARRNNIHLKTTIPE